MTPAPDPLDELRPQDPAAESLAADADSLDAEAAKHQDRSIIGRWVVAVFLRNLIALQMTRSPLLATRLQRDSISARAAR